MSLFYHGSPYGGLSSLSDYGFDLMFLTRSKEVARQYTKVLAASGRKPSSFSGEQKPTIYTIDPQLDESQIFDTRKAAHRVIYDEISKETRALAKGDPDAEWLKRDLQNVSAGPDTGMFPDYGTARLLKQKLEPLGFTAAWISEGSQGASLMVFGRKTLNKMKLVEKNPGPSSMRYTRAVVAEAANRIGRASRRRGAPRLQEDSDVQTLAAWLTWNDPNGTYETAADQERDRKAHAKAELEMFGDLEQTTYEPEFDPLTLKDAWELVESQAEEEISMSNPGFTVKKHSNGDVEVFDGKKSVGVVLDHKDGYEAFPGPNSSHTHGPQVFEELSDAVDYLKEHGRMQRNPGRPQQVTSIHGGSAALRAAIKKYLTFHQLEPKRVHQIKAVVPVRMEFCGEATTTFYKSDKWTGKQQRYYHDHDRGVKLYVTEGKGDGRIVAVPAFIRDAKAICELGESQGVEFNTKDGVGALKTSPPHPRLCTIPSGKALLILNTSLTKVEAILWGGDLNVLDVGIVH